MEPLRVWGAWVDEEPLEGGGVEGADGDVDEGLDGAAELGSDVVEGVGAEEGAPGSGDEVEVRVVGTRDSSDADESDFVWDAGDENEREETSRIIIPTIIRF